MIRVNEDVIYRCVADEHMLIPVGTASKGVNGLFVLTETGAAVWQGLSDGKTAEEITALLCQEYDAPKEEVKADVLDLISKLLDAGLITEE